MIVSYNWLKEYVDIDMTAQELADRLTMSGTEVEGLHYLGEGICGVITAQIASIEPHPTADRLLVCNMEGATPAVFVVVTAARNLSPGDIVPVATVGATLPGGKAIGRAEFGGVISEGMLVSQQELGLEKESLGIMILPEDTPLGADIKPLVGLDDWAIELKITPNRPDCLCMLGIAREVAAITGAALRNPVTRLVEQGRPADEQVSIRVEAPDLCPRYAARVVSDIKVGPSPDWLQQRLRAVGVRPISNVVDVTNYVMLELNQPLHAFDLTKLSGPAIVVRRAIEGEAMATLDGLTRSLNPNMLLICDAEKPVALAGVMGGLNSEISDSTDAVLIESANFERVSIWRTSKDVKLRTEASSRFEKGLDPENAATAVDRAAFLIAQLADGSVCPGRLDEYVGASPRVTVALRPDRAETVLGVPIPVNLMMSILRGLEFVPELQPDGTLAVGVPSFRKDVSIEADLIEEIGRIYGYENIPGDLPRGATTMGGVSRAMAVEDLCIEHLVDCGLYETLTYAFTNPKMADRVRIPDGSALRERIQISNPLTEDFSVMRTLLLGSILEAAERNVSHRISDLALFESARVYFPGEPMPVERRTLAGVVMGTLGEAGWNRPQHEADFYDLKGMLLGMLARVGVPELDLQRSNHPTFHPGRSADIWCAGSSLGTFGEVHPEVAAEFGLPKRAYGFELDLDGIIGKATASIRYSPIPRFPALRRDLAILVGLDVPAAEVEAVIRREAGSMLESVGLFDRYMGKQVPDGYQSMAYAVTYRSGERTLTDEEANAAQARVETALGSELGARIRS